MRRWQKSVSAVFLAETCSQGRRFLHDLLKSADSRYRHLQVLSAFQPAALRYFRYRCGSSAMGAYINLFWSSQLFYPFAVWGESKNVYLFKDLVRLPRMSCQDKTMVVI